MLNLRYSALAWSLATLLLSGLSACSAGYAPAGPTVVRLGSYPPQRRPTVERVDTGPDAVRYWSDNRLNFDGLRAPETEVAAYRDALQKRVEVYLAARSLVSPRIRDALLKQQIALGMRAEEVLLLLDVPWERGTDSDILRRHAWEQWPTIAGRVDEVWTYRQYHAPDTYDTHAVYFRTGRVESIIKYSWAVSP